MAVELWSLFAAIFIGFVHITVASTAAKGQTGIRWSVGPRDEPQRLTGFAGRMERAQRNFEESFPLFAAAVVLLALTDAYGLLSQIGAPFYVLGRIAYLPTYGVPWVRTIVWQLAMIGIGMIMVQTVSAAL